MSRQRSLETIEHSEYVTIGELVRLTGVRYSTLKFYTEEGMLPFEQAEENLTRRYRRVESIDRITYIRQLREQKMTIPEIKKLLEQDGEILLFLDSVYRLADAHVERYLRRGFTDLMFSFGCTGGQHRSVYAAQHLAEHLNGKFGIEVRVCHREQGISFSLPPQDSRR